MRYFIAVIESSQIVDIKEMTEPEFGFSLNGTTEYYKGDGTYLRIKVQADDIDKAEEILYAILNPGDGDVIQGLPKQGRSG